MKTVLITGISGFVGNYLARLLLEKNFKIAGTYINKDELKSLSDVKDKLDLYELDIIDEDAVDEVINKIKPDYVYHLAGYSSGKASDRDLVFKINVDGTLNILKALKNSQRKSRVLLASTSYVYGSSDDCTPFTEDSKVDPLGIYAESKLEMEKKSLGFLSNNIEVLISRAFNHAGPGQTDKFVVAAFAKQIAEIEAGIKEPKIFVGNLEAVRDFSDVRDVVRFYYLLMNKGESGEIYNVCSGSGYKILEILDKLLKLSKSKIQIEVDQDRLRPSDIVCSIGNFSKAKTTIGWEPEVKINETLQLTLDYWRSRVLININ